jgi:hypothetical protein
MQSRLARQTIFTVARYVLWRGRRCPPRMRRNGRNVEPVFADNERLYMRCQAEWVDELGRIKPAYVHFPDQSVNRARFSKFYDVLLPMDSIAGSETW